MKHRSTWTAQGELSLVWAAQNGDVSAFDALVRHYRPALTLIARSVRAEGWEDEVQEALLLAFRRLDQLSDPTKFGAWLATIVRHRCRRTKPSPILLDDCDALVLRLSRELRPCAWRSTDRWVEREVVWAAVSDLPAELALPLTLVYGEEWSLAEVGLLQGVSESTVKWRLAEGRRRLRTRLNPPETTP